MHQCRSHPARIFVMRPGLRVSPLPAAGFHEYMLTLSALTQNKQRWAWLALRTARDHYRQHFGKIGTGNIEALVQEIEKEQQEKEKMQKSEEMPGVMTTMGAGEDNVNGTGATTTYSTPAGAQDDVKPAEVQTTDVEGDVKMEDR